MKHSRNCGLDLPFLNRCTPAVRQLIVRITFALLIAGAATAGVVQSRLTGGLNSIDWFTVEGGGAIIMTGGGPGNEFEITGSVGQPRAGVMVGGAGLLEVIGGFGALYSANEARWIGGTSGLFHDGPRWDEGVVPDTFDTVIFENLSGPLTLVSVTQSAHVGRLLMRHDSPVLLEFQGTDLVLRDDSASFPSLVIAPEPTANVVDLRILNNTPKPHGLHAGRVSIAEQPGSKGQVVVAGLSNGRGKFSNTGDMWIGREGEGLLDFSQRTEASSIGNIVIGAGPEAEGGVFASGPNTTWTTQAATSNNELIIGEYGFGVLEIDGGAYVTTTGFNEVTLGLHPWSYGQVVVNGPESVWEVNQSVVTIGAEGTGQILLFNGGTITHSESALAGANPIFVLGSDGWLEGDGTIRAWVFNFGTVRPIGTLTIDGNYDQGGGSAGGSLIVQLGSIINELHVTGTARLGGGLFIEVEPGTTFQPGQLFNFLSASQFSPALRTFDVAFMPGLSNSLFLTVQYATAAAGGGVFISVGELGDLINFGDGSQSVPLPGTATAVIAEDFDGDGIVDIAITLTGADPSQQGSVLILFNDGEGGFDTSNQYPVGRQPSALAAGDFTDNGMLDIAVTNEVDGTLTILLNQGNRQFSATTIPVGASPSSVVAGDLRGLGLIDLAVTNAGDDTVHVFHNSGNQDGQFDPAQVINVGPVPSDIVAGHVLGNEAIDLVIANAGADPNFGEPAIIILGQTNGDYIPQIGLLGGHGTNRVLVDDFNNNKDLDIVGMNSGSGDASFFLNLGEGNFAPAVNIPLGGYPQSIAAWDMNDSGVSDLAFVVDDVQVGLVVRILRNDTAPNGETLVFSFDSDLGEGENPVLVTSGDVTGDGKLDLITVNAGSGTLAGGGESFVRIRPNQSGDGIPGDLNNDGVVDGADLLILLSQWGKCADPGDCPADLNNDGLVDGADLLILLANWG